MSHANQFSREKRGKNRMLTYGSITQPSPMGAADGLVLEDIDIVSCFLQLEKRPYYGGKNDYIRNNNWSDFSKPIIYPDISHQLKTSIDLRSPQEHLANIIQGFHISVVKLSTVFSVPWKLVYAWIDGDSLPNDEQLRLIIQFSHAADLFQATSLPTSQTSISFWHCMAKAKSWTLC
ncbi:MAG: hypothetical protein HQM04_08300, partial [Magnetococcales bacterium]|nr:hypothetical protein [Magnetococcales bacterium]MBF0115032.1 hypothetical protein [Magnetococcales bacterium]